ncbi:MAG: hypothetical protein HQK86_07595 [Nitrospinae bacterium]|nr:hypothetical protein [Nitrospinota bacterium]
MDKRKTTKKEHPATGLVTARPSAKKLARELIVPETDRYLRRLGVTGLVVDDGTPR